LKPLAKNVDMYCKSVILLDGTGTQKFLAHKLKTPTHIVHNIKDAVKNAQSHAKKGDIIILSPAFASFGMFTNEYDRNDQFMKIVRKLK
jgi:UDP-N-acetylmuramoylalanine-D-glutamate ligase